MSKPTVFMVLILSMILPACGSGSVNVTTGATGPTAVTEATVSTAATGAADSTAATGAADTTTATGAADSTDATAATGAADPTAAAKAAEYHKITAADAHDIIAGPGEFILVDVRTEDEFREGHIGGAILIPDSEIANRAAEELPDKDALILVYCRSGRRSANAANALVSLGYTNVYDLGGIIDWPYETVK